MNVIVTKENESVIYNGKIYSHGQSFDVDDVIGQSLVDRGYVSVTAQEATAGGNPLEELSYAELKKLAAERGVAATGKKDELMARLMGNNKPDESDCEAEDDVEESADELPNTDMPE